MKSDEELRDAYSVFVDDDGILNVVSLAVVRDPESNTRLAELRYQEIMTVFDEDPERTHNMLVDLLSVKKGGYNSSKARRIYLRLASHRQIRRFAIVGGSVFIRTMAGFIIRAAGKGRNMKWFSSREEAVEWLTKDRGG